ncbi:hypothetical protein IDAT_07705 [Pseudidiomarina atlantica]|jgi:2-dehydropantoate 2-reductase|uniref:2-dehydropantoate 2-reductase n=1 Tax=Pseudidiomarina atlantica TaxID=1517416 RepID=A0A094J7P5_9GAMM|nr:2-dehydropantoate 2-reductase [Pseudidiomarina atlantica]KFZ28626.1 hypothetical protein IDAT_07705 [Pseudidiomarina atlantica]
MAATSELPWLVIGQGALGSLMAVRLAQQQHQVAIKLRDTSVNSVAITEQQQTYRFNACAELTTPAIIFAAVKAYQVEALLQELLSVPEFANSQLILSYNGMLSNEGSLIPSHALHWVTTHGAYRDNTQLVHAGHGQSWLGWHAGNNPQPACFETLATALPPLRWQTNIQQRRWHKLAINCLINPFTVLYHCRNGALEHLVKPQQWQQLATEIVALAEQHGVHLQVAEILQQTRQVVQQTAANRSSMLQDFEQGRLLEIGYLNGFVATASAAAGLAAPANHALWQQVQDAIDGRDLQ